MQEFKNELRYKEKIQLYHVVTVLSDSSKQRFAVESVTVSWDIRYHRLMTWGTFLFFFLGTFQGV